MKTEPTGVLVVDKPAGLTSHDVVSRVRRALGTRRVGHAGTLDPMATGVLVVLVGEATKLAPFVTAHEKRYSASIVFGRETSTLDADGETTAERAVPGALLDELRTVERGERLDPNGSIARAIATEKLRTEQVPPNVSAIHVDGERSHDRARRGELFTLEARPVHLIELAISGATVEPPALTIDVAVSKGFYIRALARDLGEALGTGAHLSMLRRTRSGPFNVSEAVKLENPDELRKHLVDLSVSATRALPTARLTEDGAIRARAGKRLTQADFESGPGAELTAWLSPTGALVAVGETEEHEGFRVVRGFNTPTSAGPLVAP